MIGNQDQQRTLHLIKSLINHQINDQIIPLQQQKTFFFYGYDLLLT